MVSGAAMAYRGLLGAREVVRVLLPAALPFVVFDGHPPREAGGVAVHGRREARDATMATTTNALRRDFGFATSGACGIERVSGRVLSMN